MMNKETITICGKEVQMLYCAAAETGYERLSGQSVEVFNPRRAMLDGQPLNDSDGGPVYEPSPATLDDYIKLAISAIIAAYARDGKDAPITAEEVLYDASSEDIKNLIMAVARVRSEWYMVSTVIPQEESEDEKNV